MLRITLHCNIYSVKILYGGVYTVGGNGKGILLSNMGSCIVEGFCLLQTSYELF
jgi:hypothetical protein